MGVKYLTKHTEFENQQKLQEMLDLLEDTSIWEQISLNKKLNGSTQITFGHDILVRATSLQLLQPMFNYKLQ